jgi:hypothetical protein
VDMEIEGIHEEGILLLFNFKHNITVQHFWRPCFFLTARARPPKKTLVSVAADIATENKILFSVAKPWPPKINRLKRPPGSFFSLFLSSLSLSSIPIHAVRRRQRRQVGPPRAATPYRLRPIVHRRPRLPSTGRG